MAARGAYVGEVRLADIELLNGARFIGAQWRGARVIAAIADRTVPLTTVRDSDNYRKRGCVRIAEMREESEISPRGRAREWFLFA